MIRKPRRRFLLCSHHAARLWLVLGAALFCIPPVFAAEESKGQKIYAEKCASCHGKQGEGSKEYGRPLEGDRSIGQLSKYIAKTMPEDDPGTCTGDDADQVAAYIHGTFYSKTAQARNKPARIDLSRLTVRQYQNTLADLIGRFRGEGKWEGGKGLKAEYYNSHRPWKKEDRIIERVDPTVQFDFGVDMPAPATGIGHRFFIRWDGSVLAPETGDYEFIVRTEHSVKLWVNDPKKPLIDRWVKSGDDTEFRETIHLLGGRVYPIKLEFSKGKQGEKDGKKDPDPPPTKATIALLWKQPGHVQETIAQRYLSPEWAPETFVVQTPFPPDDRSVGYERGSTISKAWDSATTDAALEIASYVVAHLRELAGFKEDGSDREAKVQEFCRNFAERAFRRPLTDEQKAVFLDRPFAAGLGPDALVKRVVLGVLKSPRFLYHDLDGQLDSYDVASRISYGLWDSLPDNALLQAAAEQKLATPEEIAAQAERMVNDLRTRSKVREFLLQWLRVDRTAEVSKDSQLFPQFSPEIASDLRTSLELFLEDVVWTDSSDFRRLFLEEDLYLNGRLAKFYEADLPEDAGFQKIKVDESVRAGLLTHPYLMAVFAYTAASSPIHRGVFLSRGVLGRTLAAPPEAVAPLAPDLHADLTTRERVSLQTSPKSCLSCHEMINPLGYTLENFDAVGRFRKEEKGKLIDASGVYHTKAGEAVEIHGSRSLGTFVADSDEAHSAFVQQLFHYLMKQPIRAFGDHATADLSKSFEQHGFNIRKLMVDVVASAASTARTPVADVKATPIPVASGR